MPPALLKPGEDGFKVERVGRWLVRSQPGRHISIDEDILFHDKVALRPADARKLARLLHRAAKHAEAADAA